MNLNDTSKHNKANDDYQYLLKLIEQKNQEIETLKVENQTIKSKYLLINNILSLVPTHVYWKDLNGVYLGCNDEQAKTLGFKSGNEIIGKTDKDLPWKQSADFFRKIDLEVIQQKKIISAEEKATLPNNKQAIFYSTKRPLYDSYSGKIIGVLGISVDITEIKNAQEREKLVLHNTIVEKSRHAKIEEELRQAVMVLTGSIVHDLRSPVGLVSSIAQACNLFFPTLMQAYNKAKQHDLLENFIPPSRLEDFAKSGDILMDTAQQMFEYINQTLNTLSKTLVEDLSKDDLIKCSIQQCLQQTLKRYPFADEERILIKLNKQQDFEFMGNEILMIRIISNLLKNALYQIHKNQKGKIFIDLKMDDKENILIIKDTAGGAKPEVVETLFDAYKTTKKEGTGIGLAFCKKTMNDFGGDITCHSVYGDYIEFKLSFPKIH